MEDIASIFLSSVESVTKKERGFQVRLARDSGIDTSYLNRILKGKTPGSDNNRRAIAAALGYPGAKYEDFLNIGRRKLGLISDEEPAAPEGDTVTIRREEYEALKAAREKMGDDSPANADLEDIKRIVAKLTVHSDHEGIKTLLEKQLEISSRQIEATVEHSSAMKEVVAAALAAAIKHVRDEEHEKALARRDSYIVELHKEIEDLKDDRARLRTKVEGNIMTLVERGSGSKSAA